MRFTKLISVVAAGVIGLVPGAAPAAAQANPGQNTPEYAPTMLVLDASGSMLAPDSGGGAKMDAAKAAVRNFVTAAPAASQVGLSVYGTGTGSTDAEKAAGCRDVRVLRKAETIDKPALTAAVDGIVPRGYTPIGAALRAAAEALPKPGPSSIVLVSDGLDTCAPPDPCEVAKELTGQGHQIVMHAIGFGVDDASRTQLTCIAHTTGGTYTDAADGSTLEKVLPRVSAAALRNYAPVGTRIEGAPAHQTAPVATPGQYLDVIGHKQQRFYAVDIPEGATAYFSGTVSFPRGKDALTANNGLNLQVFGPGGQDCQADEHRTATRSSDGIALTIDKVWTGAAQAKTGSGDGCEGGGRYYFSLEWDHVAFGAAAQLPIELLVGVEPGVVDAGPAPDPTPTAFAVPATPFEPVVGGGSFNVAAELGGSGRYTDIVQRGEFVFYKVKVEWGQGLAYRVRFLETPTQRSEGTSSVGSTLYTPWRAEIGTAGTAYTGSTQVVPADGKALATVPIRYRNREAANDKVAGQSVAGWYYLAVKVSPHVLTGATDAAAVPIELELTVTGDPQPGPSYQGAAGTFGEDGRPKGPQAAPAAEPDGISALVWAAGGAVLLLVVGGLVLALKLRRRGGE
ncbi:VWA domain-containing protein [Nocardia sp. NPDC051832]|uniref:vWA domain-containing protein n=1 Tax=Nocardia sp. NPDC051832 TaxID=3155673 RepID=UPI0034359D8A